MTKTFTLREVAKAAIQDYQINSGEPTTVLDRVSKKIKRYVEKNYGEGTEITKEIREDINSWDGLYPYFKDQAERDWKGKKFYEIQADKMKDEKNTYVQKMYYAETQNPEIRAIEKSIEHAFEYMKYEMIDKVMFNYYLYTDNMIYKEEYKIVVQNNFSESLIKFSKKALFNKYFIPEDFLKDFSQAYIYYDDPLNVDITPEMAEAIFNLKQEDSYKKYLKLNTKNN